MSSLTLCIFALLAVGCRAANIQPTQYTLQLFIDTDKDEFSGDLVINATVLYPGAVDFVLHNNGLNISSVSVVQEQGPNIYSSMYSNTDDEYLLIRTANGLSTSKAVQITIAYQGAISTDPTGLFSFWDSEKKFYMTNFYPIYARKVFPCIDEPGVAAPISLTIITTKDVGDPVASTSLLRKTDLPNGYKKYELSNTPAIAPYSLFFTVGDWNSDAYIPPGKNTKVWLPPSLKSQANNIDPNLAGALRNTDISYLLSYYTDHFNVFVVPTYKEETYSGLNAVVLRKDLLIKNPHETTTEMERAHLLRITYALWKVFLGTTLRPADWGNNWLTTSLPWYLAYKALDEPNFSASYGNSDENLVSGLYERVFEACSAIDSPVPYTSTPPTKPADILSFVESAGVEKGVYALKTMESFVDPFTLKAALVKFIILRKNDTAIDTMSFLKFIEKNAVNPKIISNIYDVMLPILSQPGYPLVSLNRDGSTLDMVKMAFVKVGRERSQISQLADVSSWILPITATTSQNPSPSDASLFFFNAGSNNHIQIGSDYPDNGWALLNLDGKGMMRTSYDIQSWSLFAAAANSTFSPATRAKLIADAFATAESKQQPWAATLKYLEALDSETHLAPWKVALAGFKRMWSWIYHTGSAANTQATGQINLVEPFKIYVRARLNNIYKKLGPVGNNDDPQDPLRREIVGAMCEYGDSSCVSNLTAQYNSSLYGANPSNDMLSVVVCNGLRNAKIDVWNSAFNDYVFSGSWFPQPLLNSHYRFLACPDSDGNGYSEAINSFLSTALLNATGKTLRHDQIVPAVSAILDNPQHVDQVLAFFVKNQPDFNLSTETQAKIVMEIGNRLTSPTQTATLSKFLHDHNVTSDIGAALNASIAAGNKKSDYIKSIQSQVQAALNSENPTVPPPTGSGSTETTGTASTPPGTTVTTQSPPASTTPSAASAAAFSIVAFVATLAVALAAQQP